MSLPRTALTPEGYHLTDASIGNPFTAPVENLDPFFHQKLPAEWLPEHFAPIYGGDTSGFVNGLRTLTGIKRFPLKTFAYNLLKYLTTEAGKNQLSLLKTLYGSRVASDNLAASAYTHAANRASKNVSYYNDDSSSLVPETSSKRPSSSITLPPETRKRAAIQSAVANSVSSTSTPAQIPKPSLTLQPSVATPSSSASEPLPAFSSITSTAAASSSGGSFSNDEQDFHRLRERFKAMKDEHKWKLPSGQYAENILYEAGRQVSEQCSMHSFIIDMADKRTREAFTEEDWNAIKTRAATIEEPVLHPVVERYLNKFDLSGSENKLDKLRAATLIDGMKGVNLGCVGLGKEDQILYELELVRKLMLDWWFIYRKESSPFITGTLLSEAWWSSHCFSILGHLVDDVENCYAINGEKTGLESSRRKNRHRPEEPVKATRKKMGTKSDVFIRTLGHTPRDWSIVESGHLWDSFGNKVIGESRIKVSRQLHDILCHRAQETKWSDYFISEAKVVGFVTGGSMLTRMDLVFGGARYTTILKGQGLFKMAETLNQFKLSLKVAKFLLQTRGLVINLMTLFNRCLEDSEEDDEGEGQDYVNEYIASSPGGEYII
ncbi:hypothetical protein BG011_003749 [Mortierella polycephala]|uniref:Uncharacterized protein n=1 Tax=Mortierella polycephala TaxID=41804 RepID=A0A9P6Q4B3_9FUNG|nr:hypothetical protein BG011_003749 [Mortierella polycephala]